ncbi:hypothetical protein PJJ30_18440 [Mycobacterium kansasii]|uniref:Uncharacterized protein n=1 Tax=Mycobacterium kansasii TaxID=1768 RepID=A0A7G1I505_MYCKA|nr:hypothetical protein [Mycobacterium persicum]BCI86076.1 hypothetical protein NIIDMKKI_12820 [Mycobacterium kansasii]
MSHTEIPTDLLREMASFIDCIYAAAALPKGVDHYVQVNIAVTRLAGLQPLVKWLEYIQATWDAERRPMSMRAAMFAASLKDRS